MMRCAELGTELHFSTNTPMFLPIPPPSRRQPRGAADRGFGGVDGVVQAPDAQRRRPVSALRRCSLSQGASSRGMGRG
jgi:hypothetical protein